MPRRFLHLQLGFALAALLQGCATVPAIDPAASRGTGTVEGTVIASPGAVAGLRLEIEGTSLHTRANRTGWFQLAGVPTGERWLIVRRGSGAPARIRLLVHRGEATVVHFRLELLDPFDEKRGTASARSTSRGSVVTGTIRDSTSHGVAYANVIVTGARRGAQSDEDGSFRVVGVPPGKWVLRVGGFDGRSIADTILVVEGADLRRDYLVPAASERRELRREVVEQQGIGTEPWVPPAEAQTLLLPQLGTEGRAESDSVEFRPGAQDLRATLPGGRCALHVRANEPWRIYASCWPGPGAFLRAVRILDADGLEARTLAPVGAAADSAVSSWNLEISSAVTAPAGSYRAVFETSAGRFELPFSLRWTRVPPGPPRPEDQFIGGTVEGTVADSTGRPIPYADVFVLGTRRGTACDDHGSFRITHVPTGEVDLRVLALGYDPRTVKATVTRGATTQVRIVVFPVEQKPVKLEW